MTYHMQQSNLYDSENKHGSGGAFLFWFIIITLVVWILIKSFKDNFTKDDCEDKKFDNFQALCAALVVAVIITFIICIFSCGSNWWGN